MTNEAPPTDFARWRRQVSLSIDQAADLLGLTGQMVRYLEHGRSPRGVCLPQTDTRRLMTAIAKKADITPWPISSPPRECQTATGSRP